MYTLTNVNKQYKKKNGNVNALNDINLTIEPGSFVSIQGSTGGGKSTLLQLLGGLDVPTSGVIQFDNVDLAKMKPSQLSEIRGTKIGFVFQAFNLIPTLTALENVETGLIPSHVKPSERRSRAEETLASVGLADRMNHYPVEMSGGQQQRVAIARALVKKPEVILADEPTGNLDEETRDEIFSILTDLWKNENITLIVVTHDTEIAQRASHKLYLKKGKIFSDTK